MSVEKSYKAISITIPRPLANVVEELTTPQGLLKPPKGTMSGLLSMLLIHWVEQEFKADWIDIQSVMRDNPDRNIQEIREFFLKAQTEENYNGDADNIFE